MEELPALLAACAAAPEDDLPRLVLADYLEERGDNRGLFIRVQCELTRVRGEVLNREQDVLALEQEVRAPRRRGVRKRELRRQLNECNRQQRASRRAIKRLEAREKALLVHARRLWLRELLIPKVARVRTEFDRGLVCRLDVSGCGVGDGRVTRLARSPVMSTVRWLSLRRNRIGSAGAKALATSPYFRSLDMLDLADNRIRTAGARALASAARLRLTRMLVDDNPIGPTGRAALRIQ